MFLDYTASSPVFFGCMSSSQDSLKAAMREALEANGTMTHVKAQLRAAIFQSLCDATSMPVPAEELGGEGVRPPMGAPLQPPPPPENVLINELIKEYLAFNGLEHSLAVFQLEARVPDSTVPRRVLAAELKLRGAPADVPLLYAMLNENRQAMDESRR